MNLAAKIVIGTLIALNVSDGCQAATYWLPYQAVKVQSSDWGSAATWGSSPSANYKDFTGTTDNVVWDVSRVFWDTIGGDFGWFNTAKASRNATIVLHNPTSTSYTGTSAVQLYLFKSSDGSTIDETSLWTNDDSTTTSNELLLKTTGLPSGVSWNTTANRYEITVAAHNTVLLDNISGSTDGIFSYTNTDPGDNSTYVAKIVGPTGSLLYVSTTGQDYSQWRANPNNTSYGAGINQWVPYGYKGIDTSAYTTDSNKLNLLTLPLYHEQFVPAYNSGADCTTQVFFVNGDDSSGTFTIQVREQDGTLINQKSVTLAAHQRYGFTPSSYMNTENSSEDTGYVEIYGKLPVATAILVRFPKNLPAGGRSDGTKIEEFRLTQPHSEEFFHAIYNSSTPPN